ncbi:unnamed protein product [Lota lota]
MDSFIRMSAEQQSIPYSGIGLAGRPVLRLAGPHLETAAQLNTSLRSAATGRRASSNRSDRRPQRMENPGKAGRLRMAGCRAGCRAVCFHDARQGGVL